MTIKFDFAADVSGVVRGTADIADRFEDVADTLADLARDGDAAGDKLADSLKDGGSGADKLEAQLRDARDAAEALGKADAGKLEAGLKDAGTAAGNVEDKGRAAFRALADDARAAGRTVGREVKDGTDKAGEGFENLRDESVSTATEAAASIGSVDDAAGALQEVLANAFAGFGPAGMAAGLAAAAGIGFAMTAAQDLATANNDAKQSAVDMVDAIAEAGGNLGDVDLSERVKAWGREILEDNWWTPWANEASTKFQETAKDAETFGVKAGDAIRAAAGSADDSRKFLDDTSEAWQALTRTMDRGSSVTEAGAVVLDESAQAAKRKRDALSDLRGQAEANITATEGAVEIYGLESDAIADTTAATEANTEALLERADALDRAAGRAMSADKAELDYVATMQQSAADIASNGKTIDVHTEAGRANRETLLEMATSARTLIDAQIAQGDSTAVVTGRTQQARDSFIRAAEAAGFTKGQARALADQYGLIPGNVDTHVKAHNVQQTKAELDGVAAPRNAPINAVPGTDHVTNWIRGMNGKTVSVNVAPRMGVGITD